jgi:hypothetical protein
VLGIEYPYSKEAGNRAETEAKAIFESRGNIPRLFRNTLVFLAVDQTRLQDLDEAVRRYLAWEWIIADKESLNLSPHQVRQAETHKASADATVTARLPEAYQWLLVPVQSSPQNAIEWQALRLSGQDALAVRASKKLRNEELLITALAGTTFKMALDRVPLWRGNHVEVKQLVEDFARYVYLPRVTRPSVLLQAISEGLRLLTWNPETFAYADGFDDAAERYRGLRCGEVVMLSEDNLTGLLVKPDVAAQQRERDIQSSDGTKAKPPDEGKDGRPVATTCSGGASIAPSPGPSAKIGPRRFHGSVTLRPTRAGVDAGQVADEVIAHLAGLVGSDVTVNLEIEARIPSGVPENVVRTVTENCRTLKFAYHGFEKE